MSLLVLVLAALVILAAIKYLNHTDIPKIKNLAEVPGVPLFGNLLQLGSSHADACRKLATKYGPIFQVRLGNRVRAHLLYPFSILIRDS
jgi:phenylacetate 2-hydroxylase